MNLTRKLQPYFLSDPFSRVTPGPGTSVHSPHKCLTLDYTYKKYADMLQITMETLHYFCFTYIVCMLDKPYTMQITFMKNCNIAVVYSAPVILIEFLKFRRKILGNKIWTNLSNFYSCFSDF